uniref:KASH domain-containing protein n=1 Tax=Anabas testudineus TaxID=64144 RepID=A0AAQ6IQR6_ANATE
MPHVEVQMLSQPHSCQLSNPVTDVNKSSSLSKTHKSNKSKIKEQPKTMQSNITPQPLIMVRSEVHSKARSMARSRLEKARCRLQGRIQQAIELFGGKEISESQAKKKQKALMILQPAVLEEFLNAVEGFGAFCSEPQLQDLTLFSDSIRKQWEYVRSEMAALVPALWSKLRELSGMQCQMETNTVHETTNQTDRDSLQQQQAAEGAASAVEQKESLRELHETLAAHKSSYLATDQPKESDKAQETQTSDTVLPADSRGRQLGGNTPLRATGVSACRQQSNKLLAKQNMNVPKQDLSPVAGSVPLCDDIQDVPAESKDHLTQLSSIRSGINQKPSLRAPEQLLKARLLQQTSTHIQAVVKGDTVRTKQEAEWTVISEAVTPQHEECPSAQEVLERYRQSCLVFQSQLQNNKQQLECISGPFTISTLQNQKKQLEALKQETEALWFDFELQCDRLSQPSLLMTSKDIGDVERDRKQLTQEWGGQQMCLQSRMTSLQNTADVMESADDQMALIAQKLDKIIRESVEISSFTLINRSLLSDLNEMDVTLQLEIKKLSEQSSEEERQQSEVTSPSSFYQALQHSVHHLKQLRQQLEKVLSAALALDRFLATVRQVKAEIPTLLANQDPNRQQNKPDWEQEGRSWQLAMQQRLQTAAEQSDSVDSSLKAVGMTLTMSGATVKCQDVVTLLSKHVVDVEKNLVKARKRAKSKDDINPVQKEQIYSIEALNPVEVCENKTEDGSIQQKDVQEQDRPSSRGAEEKSRLEAKRSRLEGENNVKTEGEEGQMAELWRTEWDVKDERRRGGIQFRGEKESLFQKRAVLLGALREIRGVAEQLGLQEPTLPALQQRSRVLTELESRLAGLYDDLQHVQDASSSGSPDLSQSREVENLWEETTKAVRERLEQCLILTELLKRFQSIRGDLSGTLQRAESIISKQTSYLGKDNLQKLHLKVQETKAELNGLGERIEEVRSVCRQLHIHLRQIPECTIIPFESEAEALMDQWLDLSERTDSYQDNLYVSLTLWVGVQQLGADVESWIANKVSAFAESSSCQTENDIKIFQKEIAAQEESMEHFHRKATEIQSLLQSTELPAELQVVETQMRKKIEQLKELASEAEDVYRQMVGAKGQITIRMAKCWKSLQKIQDSLLSLSGSDVSTVLTKLKELCWQLQTQDEQAESLLEDLSVLASIARPGSVQDLSTEGIQLQEKIRNTHQLFSEVQEQTEKDIQDLDRLQREREHLEQWLQTVEEESAKEEDRSLLQEKALQQRVRTELLSQLVSSLQKGSLKQVPLVEESRKLLKQYYSFNTDILGDSKNKESSLKNDIEVFQALSSSTRSWVADLGQHVDSPLGKSLEIQRPVEQRLHNVQAIVNATAEGQARIEELRVTGSSLNQRLCDGDDLKQEIQETIQNTEQQWKDLLQSVEPYYRVLQADPKFTSSYLAQRQEARCRVEELKCKIAQLPTLFPWPGTAQRRQAYIQLTLTTLAQQRRELAEQTSDIIWTNSSWDELDNYSSGLMAELKGVCSRLKEGVSNEEHFGQLLQDCHHKLTSLQERMSACQAQKESSVGLLTDLPALEASLQEVTDIEKDLLQLAALKDSITASSTAEAQASLSQRVSNLQNHKRAVENSIRENLALLSENHQRVQELKEEVSCVQTALKDLTESVGKLCGNHDELPDINQLKQQWSAIQISDNRITELAARVDHLQKTGELSTTQEMLPTDVILSVSAVARALSSLRSLFLHKKQEWTENIANWMTQVINQLQLWSQTVQTEPSSPSKAVLEEGLLLQQTLHERLSEKDFLLDCLDTEVSKKLEKCALDALNESTRALENLSKHLVVQGHQEVELDNKGLMGATFRSECGTPLNLPEESTAVCPPASFVSSATDNKENSESDGDDDKMSSVNTTLHEGQPSSELGTNTIRGSNVEADATKQNQACVSVQPVDITAMSAADSLMQTAHKYALMPNKVPNVEITDVFKPKTQQELQPLKSALQEINLKTDLRLKHDPENTYRSAQSIGQRSFSLNHTELLTSDSFNYLNNSLISRQENTERLLKDTTSIIDSELSTIGAGSNKEICDTSVVGPQSTKPGDFPFSSQHLASEAEKIKMITYAQDQEEHCRDFSVTPKSMVTIILNMGPQDMQKHESVGSDVLSCSQEAGLCKADLTEGPCMDCSEKTSGVLSPLISAESDKTDLENLNYSAQSGVFEMAADEGKESEDSNVRPKKVFTIVLELKPQDMQQGEHVGASTSDLIRCSEGAEPRNEKVAESCTKHTETCKLMYNELLNSSKSCYTVPECQPSGANATETTFPGVKQEELTDCCHHEEQTMSSVSSTVEDSVQTGNVLTESQISVGDNKQHMALNTVQRPGTGHAVMTEASDPESPEVPERWDHLLHDETRESESPLLLAARESLQRQLVIPESMEPGRTVQGLSADLSAGEKTDDSPDSCKHRSTMQDILSDIQSMVERSNIINRTPHIDLKWYLQSSPGELEIQLVRTVQQVLACRYQPAQLDFTAMAKQLEDAEEYSRCVQEQVATMKSWNATRVCDPNALKRAEEQWSAALLDASATVQVKAAQLDQVKLYHKQMKMTRAFLEVLAAEKEKMSLESLGSSAVQVDRLHALMKTMKQKKSIMEELLQLSRQLAVHLSDAESSGALLAWLGDVQEEWRLLEGSIKRALQQALNSTSQFSFLMKEAEELKAKLQESSFQSSESKTDLELICLTTDLTLYNQLYLHLKSQSEALVHFSLGQKEKDEIQHNLEELGSLLNVTKVKFDTSTCSCGTTSSVKMNKQLRDLIIWAKQAENHISIGKKLPLFPEEARSQIFQMKKFQTDILSRRSKMLLQVDEMKDVTSDINKEECDQAMKTIEDLYEAITESLDHVLDTMKKNLQEREKLISQLASIDTWLAETHATRDPCRHVENVSKAEIQKLESELQSHKVATAEMERQLSLVEAMAESCKDIAIGLSPGESRYLVNRLSGLWTELDGLLAHEKATVWELEELIHERTTSDKELSAVQASLKLIASDLEQQRFPLTQETLSTIACLKHMLMEHQCQVQELQHCQDGKRSSLLDTIGELQDRCKALSLIAFEQNKYLYLRREMEESREIAKEQIQHTKNKTVSVDESFTLCQILLVELPLVKTQCQEAGDQLESIAQELYPSELNSERQRIHRTVETLVFWEHSVTDDIKNLESKLLPRLHFSSELAAFIELLQRTRLELDGAKPVNPNEKAIDDALQRYWVIWRNVESGMRVLEALGQKENIDLKNYKELYSLRDATMQTCHVQMESLSQARESLKDYQWAAQGAIGFLHNAEATFLSAPGGFLDCTEEQGQTQQALEALEDGFQAHICHLGELVPQQPCLSRSKIEQLHISVLSQLLVGRAILEAQAQLRLESLQRCAVRQQSHRSCHEDIQQRLSGFEARLSEYAAAHVTSYDKCVVQQQRATLLMENLRSLAGTLEELKAGCPNQGCGAGKDGELGALWRRWVSLRRGVGLLIAHTEQRGEEWKDIITSIKQCCSFLASLQAEVPDSSSVRFTHEEPRELLAQAELHHAGLEQEQQALASLEHRLEHALSLSTTHDHTSPGSAGKTLMKIQENIRSLKERNLLVVAAAQTEEKVRQQIQDEIEEVERNMLTILQTCSNPSKQQELKNNLSAQKTKLKHIVEDLQSQYSVIPAAISRRLQEIQLSLQRAEEKVMVSSSLVQKLAGRVLELVSGLEQVKRILEQRSPTVKEAQNVLKHVWDELDVWHSHVMLLESEVQDLAEEQPDHAHLLMDQLTQPLQLYQNTAQMAEQRTSFLSKIPACLQEFEDILYSATSWMGEAQAWLSTHCVFTTARSLQNHANSLQLVLDDSERIRDTLRDFRPVLAEISAVCDISTEEEKLEQNDQQVYKMQHNVLQPLEQLLQAVEVVEAVEAELKTMEKNVSKIRTILSSVENSNITLMEHLQNRQVILANVQSMQRTLEEMEKYKGELRLPQGAEENLTVFSRARLLLQQLEELGQVTQQQVSLLESKIRDEEGASNNPGVTTVYKEAFHMSESEEEEEEDGESCHSSSSDTLTCSVAEDPEETFNASHVQYEDTAEVEALSEAEDLKSLSHQFSSDVETSSKGDESGPLSVKSGFDISDGSKTELKRVDLKADIGDADVVTAANKSLITADAPPTKEEFTAVYTLEQHETLLVDSHTKSLQAAAALEGTRLIPARPITPFAATTSVECVERGDEDLCLSTAPYDATPGLKDELEVGTTHCSTLKEFQVAPEASTAPISLVEHEGEDDKERQSWSRLYTQISRKLTSLKKVQEEHQTSIRTEDGGFCEKFPQMEPTQSRSVSAVLQQTQESIAMLRQTVRSAGCTHPGTKEELYEAVQRVLLCLDSLPDLLLTPGGSGKDDTQLRLLQQECVSTDLVTLDELLNKMESEIKPVLVGEELDTLHCLTCLQDFIHTVQLVFTSFHSQPPEKGDLKKHQELSFNQLCILDEFDVRQSEIFPSLKNAASLEQCVLGRHLRKSPGEKAKLQQASRSLLQGIIRLLELGEECKTEAQMSQFPNRSQLQAVLCGHKKLLQVLGSQLAFVQHLFQSEPETLKCQEDEWVPLEVRARALQQQALEQEAAFQTMLQKWTWWDDNCGQLGKVLDEFEALFSSVEPEGDDEEFIVQHRLDACQETLIQLDESRAALGLLQDQRSVLLQAEMVFAPLICRAGGALELRWRSAYKWTEQEIQHCRNMQDSWTRFKTGFDSVSEWLVGANKHLKILSDLAGTSDLNQERIQSHLIKLLDFSMDVEAMSAQKAAVSRDGTKLIHRREADCPRLRAQLTQLDVSWSQLSSNLSKIQEQLQQRLLGCWPPVELLSDLEDWLQRLDARLNEVKETALKVKDAAHVADVLQQYKELKAGVVTGQLLLDFLCQSGPQVLGADVQTLRSERTMFAETLSALRMKWTHFQRELENQIWGVEQMHHTCADREKRLKHLHGLIAQQKEQLTQWKQLTSQTLLHKALLEWEAAEGRVKEVTAALQELKATRADVEKEEVHPCDIAFCNQADHISHACWDICEQMETLRPTLQQTVAKWSCYDRAMQEVRLHCTRVRCALQHHQTPVFSLKQAEGHIHLLQQLGEKTGKAEELWASVEKSYQSLVKRLHCGTANALGEQMEEERKRWEDIVQEVKDECTKAAETLLLWQEYSHLSENCSLHLQNLWHQMEELSSSSPELDLQAMPHSVENLQDAADELQRSVGNVLEASKPLIGRLQPIAANLIKSETRLMSRDVLLLNWAVSRKMKSLQENLEEQKLFSTHVEALEKKMQSTMLKMEAGFSDTAYVQQVFVELSGLFSSLVDVRDMSGYVPLNNQEMERLQMLYREWIESMTRISDMNRERQADYQLSQNFEEKCKNLASIQEKLEQELVSRKAQSYSSLQEMLTVHQRLQAEIITGHQLLQVLLCDAVSSMEKETGAKRSEIMTQVSRVKENWFNSVALTDQSRTLLKEQLRLWRTYQDGLKLLWKLVRDVEPLLPPTGPAPCALDDYQGVKEAVVLHSAVYTVTLEAGRRLCETMTESESQSQLQSECRAIEEAWERTMSLLERKTDLANTTVRNWSQCQDRITNITSELDELKMRLKQQLPERLKPPEEDTFIQEAELSLQRLASGLRELDTMKTDLPQYVAAGDSALLEQQLEQLHGQWEELCMKVSLHRQEIADRLNAWTIFNDKNKEFCDWLTQMENKVCHSGDLSIEEMVEKLKKDCMEEINLFSENKSHLKQLGEQLLLASDEAKQTQVRGSLQEVNQRWHSLFHHIEARVKKLKETLATVQQLDKNMSNLRSWLSRIEAELSRPITYSICHHQEIQKRLAEQQELQKDIEQHTEGVASVLSLCDVLLRDEDAAGGTEVESDSLQETSRSLDQRWRTICAMALDRRLRIEETWRLWCKFLEDYSRFEDWLKMAERTAANPNSADVLYTVAKEELKKFEGFQRQVHERLTQLELVNNQYRRLARENRTDRASQLKVMVHEGNRRWDNLHRRVAAILRRLKYFTSQREEFENTRESMLVWLTELDLQLTNVEHFSESDVHQKMQQLNSFQKEITLNTERIDGLIVFGEGLIQKSSPQDAALIEDELEELHSYCQEVFSRLVRFHQRLSQPPMIKEEPQVSGNIFSLESSLELICRPWLGRSQGSLPATPTHLLTSPLEHSGRETPVSVDSLPLEWDPSGDVGGSSSHEDEEEEEEHEDEDAYFSTLSVPSRSKVVHEPSEWLSPGDTDTEPVQLDPVGHTEDAPTLTSTPLKHSYRRLMSQCSGSIENIKRVSLILEDEEQPLQPGLTGLTASDKQSGVIERWELIKAQPRSDQQDGPQQPHQLTSDLHDITVWLENLIQKLDCLQQSEPAIGIEEMEAKAKELKEMQKMFTRYKSVMLSVNLRAQVAPGLQEKLANMNRDWSRACTGLQQWDTSLRKTLMRCQQFHKSLHSLLLWLAHAESRRYTVDIHHPETHVRALQQHRNTLTDLQEELRSKQAQQASLQALWTQLQPKDGAEESDEAQEKLHVTGSKLRLLLKEVDQDLSTLQQRLDCQPASGQTASGDSSQEVAHSNRGSSTQRQRRESSPPRSFFYRVLRAAFPLHLLLLLLLLLPCLIPLSESDPGCSVTNNFARSFYPMLHYTNGPPPT